VTQVKALLFDVFGTVVDWRSGVIRDVTVLAAEHGADIDAASFADRWRAAYRQRWGAETLEVGVDQFSFVDIARQLGQGKCVAMLMDRPQGNGDVVMADFPHGRVPFSTGPVWLSLLSGAPLVAATILATESGGYALEALPPIRPRWCGSDRAATVREYTLELASRFREPLCNHPDQWYQFVPLSRLYSSASA